MIVVIYGTRPEAIKLGPVVAELKEREAEVLTICTGQHTDLLQGTPAECDLLGGFSLDIESDDNITRFVSRCRKELQDILSGLKVEMVVVQGDTMSAYVGAQFASFNGIKLVHVEAGVRSYCLSEPWPEEHIRTEIDRAADVLLPATKHAEEQLKREGFDPKPATGNSVVSALYRYNDDLAVEPQDKIIITLHRRELRQRGHITEVLEALAKATLDNKTTRYVWPVHPAMDGYAFNIDNHVDTKDPFSYNQMIEELRTSRGILTDSGGLVEEAATLGIPTAVLRNYNDRPEAEAVAVAKRFDPTAEGVIGALDWLDSWESSVPLNLGFPFGDDDAAGRIANEIVRART